MRKIDEMSIYNELKAAGLEDAQAKAHAAIIGEVIHLIPNMDMLATKHDLLEVKTELKRDITDLKSEMDLKFIQVGHRFDLLESRLDAKIDGTATRLDAKIDGMAAKLEAKINSNNRYMLFGFSIIFAVIVFPSLRALFGS